MKEEGLNSQVDIRTLSFDELQKVRTSLINDIANVEQLYASLKFGQDRLIQARDGLNTLLSQDLDASEAYTKNQALLPLTSSLYAYGRIPEIKQVTVDIGAKYFIKMRPERALKFYDSRTQNLQEELYKLVQALQQKSRELQSVEVVMSQKVPATAHSTD